MNDINKQTYYMTPNWFIGACMSISRADSGKYYLTQKDNKNGFYTTVERNGITLKVPFRALFDTNDKIKPFKALSFSDAIICPSAVRGLCQLNNHNLSCYARNGQLRACANYTNAGINCINSYGNSQLIIDVLKHIDVKKLADYINANGLKVIRYNLKGDFKDLTDVLFLLKLCMLCPQTIFSGYSARDDILQPIKGHIKDYDNLILNGSNCKYTNRFKVTYSLYNWLATSKICLGGCNGCRKCYTLKNQTILCLIHGKNSKQLLNSWHNRQFLSELFNALDCNNNYIENDFNQTSDLLNNLNKIVTKYGVQFKNWLEFREWLHGLHYDLLDNSERPNAKRLLKEVGVL